MRLRSVRKRVRRGAEARACRRVQECIGAWNFRRIGQGIWTRVWARIGGRAWVRALGQPPGG